MCICVCNSNIALKMRFKQTPQSSWHCTDFSICTHAPTDTHIYTHTPTQSHTHIHRNSSCYSSFPRLPYQIHCSHPPSLICPQAWLLNNSCSSLSQCSPPPCLYSSNTHKQCTPTLCHCSSNTHKQCSPPTCNSSPSQCSPTPSSNTHCLPLSSSTHTQCTLTPCLLAPATRQAPSQN